MADRLFSTSFKFNVGFATDLALETGTPSFLTIAQNVMYEASGSMRKAGGTERINSSAITGGPQLIGLHDFWMSNTDGTPTQKFMAVTNDGKVYKEDMDGTFDDITGSATITTDAIPIFCQARDLLIISFSTNDTVLKWAQTGDVASLGGSPPAVRGMAFHVNRVWGWGRNSNPSRLYYSSATDAEDWSGIDTGSIDIDPEDGDRILHCIPFKRALIIFKGPYKGSIHVIDGTSPSGGDAFVRTILTRGLPLQSPHSVIEVGDDIWFGSDRGFHSLAATQKFGNYVGADLTRFHSKYFQTRINRSRLDRVVGLNYVGKGCALWGITPSGQAPNSGVFGISYIRAEEEGLKPFLWNRDCFSAAMRFNPSTYLREPVFGSSDGYALRQDVGTRSLAGGTAYTYLARTPSVILAPVDANGKARISQRVTLNKMYVRSRSVGDYNLTVKVARDGGAFTSHSVNQGYQGFLLGTSVLGTGVLGANDIQTVGVDLSGEARTVALELEQAGVNQDAEVYDVALEWSFGTQGGSPHT